MNREIRRVIQHTTGLPAADIRPANQAAGAIGKTWATVLIISAQGLGIESVKREKNKNDERQQITETLTRQLELTVSVNVFGENAIQTLSRIRDRMLLSSTRQLMQEVGLGYIRMGTVRNLSAVIDMQWQERGQADLQLHAISTESEDLRTFGVFPIRINSEAAELISEVTEP